MEKKQFVLPCNRDATFQEFLSKAQTACETRKKLELSCCINTPYNRHVTINSDESMACFIKLAGESAYSAGSGIQIYASVGYDWKWFCKLLMTIFLLYFLYNFYY